MGKYIVFAGLGLVVLGLLVLGAEKMGLRLGRLPGDVAVERPGFGLYFPITTMILLSLVASGILFLVSLLRR